MQRIRDASFTTWLLWIALVLALLGTISNTAWAFGTVDDGNVWAGYVKAVALDVGMVVIAATLARKRRNVWLWCAVVGFVLVSTYANYQHGVAHMTAVDAPLEWLRPVLLAAALPLMLFALVEIVATGVQDAQGQSQEPSAPAHDDAHDASLSDDDWRIVAEGPAEPVHAVASVPHEVAADAAHANGNGHKVASDAKPRAWTCDVCGAVYASQQSLAAHARKHKGA